MKYLTIGLIVVGLLLGPAYLVYTNILSGSSMATHTVFEQDISHAGSRRNSVTFTGTGKWSEPVKVQLSPDMNPVRVNFSANHAPGPTNRATNQYVATLKDDSGVVWKTNFKLTTKSRDKDTISIGTTRTTKGEVHTFEVDDAGNYELEIKPKSRPKIAVANLSVSIRRNVAIPNMAIAGSGFLILILGFGLIFVQHGSRS